MWTKDEFPELAEYLKGLQPAFGQFRAATRKKDFWEPARPDAISIIEVVIPATVNGHQTLQAWDVQLWQADSRKSENIRAFCSSALRFASHVEQNSITINGLIALRSRMFAYEQLLSGLDECVIDPSEAEAFFTRCRKLDRGDFSWTRCFTVEWAFCLDGIQLFRLRESSDPKLAKKAASLLEMEEVRD